MERWGDTRDEARFLLAEENEGSFQISLRWFEFHDALLADLGWSDSIWGEPACSLVLSLVQCWVLGLAVVEFLDRLPSVGEVESRLSLLLKLSGAVNMD